ncbi:chloride channel protein 3 [Eremomyces bilateralis CBS 781.70]|uniref:Chloride channel protein n=1 Tax=Eremomyces bilateralis CBS 781.70 TaxID=1392243 RepID=A0A6G1G422_9PEZI|nr:chloride channel protein 3 [Eremomyces bilateralis CBS 781.70]KAF1812656.1 chloride channel protein 3 [Eremomyces bilateralis CBS 781.70]
MSDSPSPYDQQAESSTSQLQARVEDDESDNDDPLLAQDPLDSSIPEPTTFKRKKKAAPGFSLPRFLSSPLSGGRIESPAQRAPARGRLEASQPQPQRRDSTDAMLSYLDRPSDAGAQLQDTKDANALDWYVEGPGRRVGYDDLTAIDWIFEYSKERQRLRVLKSSANGLLGYLYLMGDASQIWLVLVATGIACGAIAAFIDITSNWLADVKGGFCSNVDAGGKFYLNEVFCCWGYEDYNQCRDWRTWSDGFGVKSATGSWILNYFVFVLFSVLFAACASFLVQRYAFYAKHSGIPEIKTVLGGFVIRRFMGPWTLVIKSLGLCFAVASGLWLGKEGPLVHVACCCANLFLKLCGSLNDNEARKREVLSAAAAAGISVAFGSPIGGVLFSLEQLSYYFPDKTMWQSFVCAMVGAVTLQFFNPFRTGKLVLYQVTYHTGWHGFELVPFMILGILGGLYGGLLIKLNMRIAEWRRSSIISKSPVLEVIAVALITALINFPIKFMRAQASELVYILFAECADITTDPLGLCKSGKANTSVVALLLIAAICGFFLSAMTFGLLIPAGIILPSMALGALYGRAVGLIMEVWQKAYPNFLPFGSCEPDIPCVTPGTYAIIGAASALGGATRMTVSIVVIMFELTGALTYVLPIMVAVMVSKWVGDAISPRGIYESWIHFNGYPFLDNRDDNSAAVPDVLANEVMTRLVDLVVITSTGHTIQSLQTLLTQHDLRGFPVIDNERNTTLLGYISRTELEFALNTALAEPRNLPPETEAYLTHQSLADPLASLDLRPWMDQTPITLNARASLQLAVSMFQRLGLRYVLFVEKGMLRGLMTKKDVWYILDGSEVRRDTNGGTQADNAGHGEADADLMLADDGSVDSRSAP